MALPSTGQLSLNDINIELGNSSGTEANLRNMSSTAGFSIPDSVSEFYGYSAGMTINYGSVTYTNNTETNRNAYRSIIRTTQDSSQVISISMNYSLQSDYGGVVTLYWSRNSTSSWTQIADAYSSTKSGTFNITNVAYNDIIRVRLYLDIWGSWGYLDGNVGITSATVTTGSGSVTRGTPYGWGETLDYYP